MTADYARAVEAMTAATVIACEDTRRTGSLLRHLGIERRRLVVLNDHTERDIVDRLVADDSHRFDEQPPRFIPQPHAVVVGRRVQAGRHESAAQKETRFENCREENR